ncbi:Homeodomain-like protein [Xylariales sp. AK1849]|nr:Homeodomain-like protein [Xylariales sp. AK1849]
MTPTRERRWWTSQEDSILKNVIKTQLDRDGKIQNWTDVAILLPGRTNKDCRKRWSKIQLDIRKGAWTHEEDERLQQAIQKLGFKWSQVATIVQSRNADQCSKRWHHALRPDFKHSPWTPEEDRKLLKAMEKHRNDWKQIGIQELPDRSTHEIRNRSVKVLAQISSFRVRKLTLVKGASFSADGIGIQGLWLLFQHHNRAQQTMMTVWLRTYWMEMKTTQTTMTTMTTTMCLVVVSSMTILAQQSCINTRGRLAMSPYRKK